MNIQVQNSGTNVYLTLTAKIAAAVEAGSGPCVMPWHSSGVPMSMPRNSATDVAYRGINIVALWIAAVMKGYGSGYWASYKQWARLGGQVRKGECGSTIVFYKEIELGSVGEDEQRSRLVARATKVFNVSQVDGWDPPQPPSISKVEISEHIDAFVRATCASIRHGSYSACYRQKADLIELPVLGQFVGTETSSPTEAYYAVLLHELTHWTGAPHRLNRGFGSRFGDRAYAFEELVAEMGAAFLCSALGVANEPRADHAAYISSWLEILGRDPKAIFTAASQAQHAVQYLADLTGGILERPPGK